MFIGMGTSTRNIVVRHAEPVLGAGSAPAAGSVLICHSTSRLALGRGPIVVDGLRVTHSGGWHDTTERMGPQVTISVDPA